MTKAFPCLINNEPTPVVAYNSEHSNKNANENVNIVNLSLDNSANALTFEFDGLSNRTTETDMVHCNSRHSGQYAIRGSRQTFPNASAFRYVLYLMSIGGNFRY